MTTNCRHCHTCGTSLVTVLDGEEWCPRCEQYRRYQSRGWTRQPEKEWSSPCLREPTTLKRYPRRYICSQCGEWYPRGNSWRCPMCGKEARP